MHRTVNRRIWLTAGLLLLPLTPLASPPLSVSQLRALALRSPNVFDTFFKYQRLHEARLPRFMFEGEAVVGPVYEISVDGLPLPAHVAGGQISLGSVPWTWGERAGLRFGADMYSTNLTPEGDANANGWGYRGALFYGSAFDRDAGWAVSLGAHVLMRPVTAIVNGEEVFSSVVENTEEAGWRSGDGSGVATTEVDSTQGFVHGTIPWTGITTGFLFDGKGIRKLKGHLNLSRRSYWESIGPQFGAVPQFKNYQAGIHATRVRPWDPPVTVSAEAMWRKEPGVIDFDHGAVSMDLTLFEDQPDRVTRHRSPAFTTDFHLRIEAGASYHRLAGARNAWGWGGRVDALEIGLGSAQIRVGLGGGRNYYPDIVMLPITDATTFRFIVGIAL